MIGSSRAWRFRGLMVSLLVSLAVVGGVTGCGGGNPSGPSSAAAAGLTVVAANTGLLHGRRVAVGLDAQGNTDVWVLSGRALTNVSRHARLSLGGNGCYYAGNGSPGPCYPYAKSFSLSRDGRKLAFFLEYPLVGESSDPFRLVVARSDGSGAREVAKRLFICALCSVSTPSWSRGGSSFVFAASEYSMADFDSIWKVYLVSVGSGHVATLTPRGAATYSERQPVVSPDGDEIAFLQDSVRGPQSAETEPAFIDLMQLDGRRRQRLPLPPRLYTNLRWCGRRMVCVDALFAGSGYRLDVRSGRIARLRHARGSGLPVLSEDGAFALMVRKDTTGTWHLLGGPVGPDGHWRLRPIIAAGHSRTDPFDGLSVSDR